MAGGLAGQVAGAPLGQVQIAAERRELLAHTPEPDQAIQGPQQFLDAGQGLQAEGLAPDREPGEVRLADQAPVTGGAGQILDQVLDLAGVAEALRVLGLMPVDKGWGQGGA